jgi:hypothetical protein
MERRNETVFPESEEKAKRLVEFLSFLTFPHQSAAKKRKQTRSILCLCLELFTTDGQISYKRAPW